MLLDAEVFFDLVDFTSLLFLLFNHGANVELQVSFQVTLVENLQVVFVTLGLAAREEATTRGCEQVKFNLQAE